MTNVPTVDAVVLQNHSQVVVSTSPFPMENNKSFLESEPVVTDDQWLSTTLLVLQATIMISIIVAAIFGNLLVIASVMRVRKLR